MIDITTITLIKVIILIIAMLVSIILHINILNQIKNVSGGDVEEAKKMLLGSLIVLSFGIGICVLWPVIGYTANLKFTERFATLTNSTLVLAMLFLVTSGILCAIVAKRIQCLSDEGTRVLWFNTTVCSLIGILMPAFALVAQLTVRAQNLSQKISMESDISRQKSNLEQQKALQELQRQQQAGIGGYGAGFF